MHRSESVAVFLLAAVSLAGQTLTPREVFYGQGRTATAAKLPARASRLKRSPVRPAPVPASSDEDASVAARQPAVEAPATQDSNVYRLAASHTGPLGLKYSVLKRGSGGEYTEVDPDTNFVSGDRIKFNVEVNDTGYLYVVTQGSSGVWKVLYPSAEANGGSNRVERGHPYSIPSGATFTFDSRSGNEKLFVILSRQPEQDMEKLIYSMKDKQPKNGELSRPMIAENIAPVENDLVRHLRETYSRDLVIEKVDDSKNPPPDSVKKLEESQGEPIPPSGEKAVYVVNPNAGENASVVADVELRHQ